MLGSPHPSLNWSSAITIEYFGFSFFFFLSNQMATVVRDLSAPLVLFSFFLDSDLLPACVVLCLCCFNMIKYRKKRTSEHLRISILAGDGLSYNEKSATALAQHSHIHNHPSGIDNFPIIGHASSRYHLLLKEALLIWSVKPTIVSINKQKYSIPLHLFGN